jgi:hypothetical protein
VLADILDAARELTPRALAALDKALDDPGRAVHAAQVLLDRAWGRPPQAIYAQVSGTLAVGGIDRPPRETLETWLARRRAELAALNGPPEKSAQQQQANGETAVPGERTSERAARALLAARGHR